ncbi:hypothetical protein PoB_003842600 [Plakobranchus ocellatus]|uniref:Uncharacterized protein n=1 Tax=Plakobranchus ocellatus TaxID=259542 RepID=A0AAV4AL65_9GAST|nr:hypothetical protein PoB_003842600 [Plakobranchus ocellatus]
MLRGVRKGKGKSNLNLAFAVSRSGIPGEQRRFSPPVKSIRWPGGEAGGVTFHARERSPRKTDIAGDGIVGGQALFSQETSQVSRAVSWKKLKMWFFLD